MASIGQRVAVVFAIPKSRFLEIWVIALSISILGNGTGHSQEPTRKAVRDLIYSACLSVHQQVRLEQIDDELDSFDSKSKLELNELAMILGNLGVVASGRQMANRSSDDLIPPCLIGVKLFDSRYQGEGNDREHFVLILGFEGKDMLVVDPHTTPDEVSRMDPRGIFTFWNGSRIRLFKSRWDWLGYQVLQYRLVAVIGLLGCLAMIYRRTLFQMFASQAQNAALLGISLALLTGCRNNASPREMKSLAPDKENRMLIVCQPSEVDLGALRIDKKTVVPCKLKLCLSDRVSDATISRIQTSCKCIKIDAENIVGKGFDASRCLEVPFDVELTSQSGEFKQTIQFTFNRDESTSIVVPISAFISNIPNALIKEIVFQSDVSEKVGRATAVFTRARMESDPQLRLADIESDSFVVKVAHQELVSSPLPNLEDRRLDSLQVTLEIPHDLPLGNHSMGELKFCWTSEEIPSVSLPGKLVHAHVVSPIPGNLFYRGNVGEMIKGEIRLRGDSVDLKRLESVQASSDLAVFGLSFENNRSGDDELTVSFQGPPPRERVRCQGEFLCEFTEDVPPLRIPVKFLIY